MEPLPNTLLPEQTNSTRLKVDQPLIQNVVNSYSNAIMPNKKVKYSFVCG